MLEKGEKMFRDNSNILEKKIFLNKEYLHYILTDHLKQLSIYQY